MSERPYFCEGSEAMVQLEAMVDRVGVRNVLHALAHICGEKASHLEANWQDAEAAKVWDKAGNAIGAAANHKALSALD